MSLPLPAVAVDSRLPRQKTKVRFEPSKSPKDKMKQFLTTPLIHRCRVS